MANEKHLEYVRTKLQTILNEFASAALSTYPKDIMRFTLD